MNFPSNLFLFSGCSSFLLFLWVPVRICFSVLCTIPSCPVQGASCLWTFRGLSFRFETFPKCPWSLSVRSYSCTGQGKLTGSPRCVGSGGFSTGRFSRGGQAVSGSSCWGLLNHSEWMETFSPQETTQHILDCCSLGSSVGGRHEVLSGWHGGAH